MTLGEDLMNLSTVVSSVFRAARQPSILLPHVTYSTFDQLPVPLSQAFPRPGDEKPADIRAVVLDKDNCFAAPKTNIVHPVNKDTFQALIDTYKAKNVLIVSNSSGFSAADPDGKQAAALEEATGVKVLRHAKRKPGCGEEVLSYFKDSITSPSQVVVIGDRLFTDTLMANTMGARSIWIRRGVVEDSGSLTRLEYGLSALLQKRGLSAPMWSTSSINRRNT